MLQNIGWIFTNWLLFRCSRDSGCNAYQFGKRETKNCYIIHGGGTKGSPQNFTSDENKPIYKKGKIFATCLLLGKGGFIPSFNKCNRDTQWSMIIYLWTDFWIM